MRKRRPKRMTRIRRERHRHGGPKEGSGWAHKQAKNRRSRKAK